MVNFLGSFAVEVFRYLHDLFLLTTAAASGMFVRKRRRGIVLKYIEEIGLGSLPLAGIISTFTGMVLVMTQPTALIADVTLGAPFVPFTDPAARWWSPIGVATIGLFIGFSGWCLSSPRRLIDLRGWVRSAREADLLGATYM
ncbi:MAG TPA: hypothetical protein PK644_01310, partial [bacterium]|nr:hypothetical protein [bacterium]